MVTSTIFADIKQVLPGQCVVFDEHQRAHQRKYYNLIDVCQNNGPAPGLDSRDLEALVWERFGSSVRKRLVSDVPVGIQLSGGVDSSLIVKQLDEFGISGWHSFSIGFSEPRYAQWSEEKYSTRVARDCKCEHHAINLTCEDIAEQFEHAIWLTDGMLAYPNTIPLYILCRHAKEHVTVMLTGDGADELFGGYGKFPRAIALSGESRRARLFPEWAFQLAFKAGCSRSQLRQLYLRKRYAGRRARILEELNDFVSHFHEEGVFY